ncbi:PH domain-containing protein [Phragmitibacter flavus]|uniref:PH domain-containing protein n=1 Tax=Phragmitibacter flavus TaxID=2576071 RepID=A0A5R8KE52_9BACT|nr:PH domain-containing protein [Phragmitibacter flavus]TLD70215.1 PH domain-containing protein [Phragmitibacter flavus]
MGFIRGLLGHANGVDVTSVLPDVQDSLIEGEEVHYAYKLVRDLIIFTNLRLITVDKQGLTGKKRTILSVPYQRISHYSKESAGHFDFDSEIEIWLAGQSAPMKFEFRKNGHVDEVYRIISHYTLIGPQ